MKYAITVILPVYNGEAYLRKSIESVLNQSFVDFEFIICNDSSTDSSLSIAESYDDKRIKILQNENNKGLFATLNRMAETADGKLIKLWSQDDVMMEDCLLETVNFHQEYPQVSFSYSDRYIIDDKDNIIGENSMVNDQTPELIDSKLHDRIALYTGSIAGNISNVTIVKSDLNEVGMFDDSMRICADFDMWVKLSEHKPVGRIQKPLVKLRNHDNQLSRASKYLLLHLKEDWTVYERLIERSDEELKAYGNYYLNWRKGILYVSFMLRVFKRGEFKNGLIFAKELSRHYNLSSLMYKWIQVKLFNKKVKQPIFLLQEN